MNRNRLKASLKNDALNIATAIVLIGIGLSVFTGLTALFGNTHDVIPVSAAIIGAYGAASIAHTFITESIAGLRKRLADAAKTAE